MKKIFSERIQKIISNKAKLEKKLKVKIRGKNDEIFIEGNSEREYYAEKVIDALNFGFRINVALLLSNDDFILEVLNIKNYTRRKDLERIRARIIGKKGKSLGALQQLTECYFEIKDNKIGIIGNSENIEKAQEAIISIIRGAKHSHVYGSLEKNQKEPILDFGLK